MRKLIPLIMILALLCASCKKSGGGSSDSSPDSTSQPSTGSGDTPTEPETPPPTPEPTPTPEPPAPTPTPTPVPAPTPTPAPPTGSLPAAAYTFDYNVKFVNLTSSQKTKMTKALEIIKLVVATEEFRSRILNHKYNGKKTFVDNGGYTNSQIYQKILDGAEKLQPTKDNELDCELEMYTAYNNVVGYTYPNSKRIWVNTKFFNQYTPAGVARNLFHEWLHKLGFTHASSYTTSRDYSVPYGIGDIVGDIAKDFL